MLNEIFPIPRRIKVKPKQAADFTINPKFTLSDEVINAILAASKRVKIIEQTLGTIRVEMPSIDWLEFGLRLMKQPLDNVAFVIQPQSTYRVQALFIHQNHPLYKTSFAKSSIAMLREA